MWTIRPIGSYAIGSVGTIRSVGPVWTMWPIGPVPTIGPVGAMPASVARTVRSLPVLILLAVSCLRSVDLRRRRIARLREDRSGASQGEASRRE